MNTLTTLPNGTATTQKTLASWAKAIKKAQTLDSQGIMALGSGKHPKTGDLFKVYPSISGKGPRNTHYCFLTMTGHLSCTCEAGQNSQACWHAGAMLLALQPMIAKDILSSAQAEAIHSVKTPETKNTVEAGQPCRDRAMPASLKKTNLSPQLFRCGTR